jgi:hypothetical protein
MESLLKNVFIDFAKLSPITNGCDDFGMSRGDFWCTLAGQYKRNSQGQTIRREHEG